MILIKKIFAMLMKARRSFLEILSISYFGTEEDEEMTQEKTAALYYTLLAIAFLYIGIVLVILSQIAIVLGFFYNTDIAKTITLDCLVLATVCVAMFVTCKLVLWLAFRDELRGVI
jgi:uncharacterized BrkB/YihY/UPF0761 family membrane protein